jgi:MFS family permease
MAVKRLQLFIGISIFWVALSMLFDGLNTLLLPAHLLNVRGNSSTATVLGLITFIGLLLGMFVQPAAGLFSDQIRPFWGRRGVLALGVFLLLAGLLFFGFTRHILTIFVAYLFIQVASNVAQAAQQGFIPDLVPPSWRGMASGLKGFMDLSGALLGFVILGQLLGEGQITLALATVATVIVILFGLTLLLVREPPLPTASARTTINSVNLATVFRLDARQHQPFIWLVLSRFLFLSGTYAVGRFLLLFVANRLNLDPARAAEEAGTLLAALALVTILAAVPAGWLADRFGRVPFMVAGALFSTLGVTLLIVANSEQQILLFGSLMALGSAAFAGANWALTADLVPANEAARFFGLANFGTAGAAAAAGLFGPLIDWANREATGSGYTILFSLAAVLFIAAVFPLRKVAVTPLTHQTQPTTPLTRQS